MLRAGLKKIGRAILLPPFPVVLGLSAAFLCAFVAWVYFDPWFAIIFKLLKPPPSGPGYVESYDYFRPTFQSRVNVFVALSIIAIVVTALAVIRLFVGSRSGRSLVAWLGMTALIGAWLGFLLSYERIKDSGFRFRTRGKLPELQTVADALIRTQGLATRSKPMLGPT